MATRGPKPTPTHLKLVRGNPGKRRLNKGEPKPPPSATLLPPPELNDDAKVEWGRRIGELQQCGLFTSIDYAAFAAYCQQWGVWMECERALKALAEAQRAKAHDLMAMTLPEDRAGQALARADLLAAGLVSVTTNGNAIQHSLIGTRNKAMENCIKFASEFGMTPSARTRIDVGIGGTAPPVQTPHQAQSNGGGGPGSYIT